MKTTTPPLPSCLFPKWRTPKSAATALVSWSLFLCQQAIGQLPVMDNFNTGSDAAWSHYAPLQSPPWSEQVTWTFPSDGAGGLAYRIFGGVPPIDRDPAAGKETGPARVGSFRNDALWTDFSAGADIVNW